MSLFVKTLLRDERGATAIEYGLLATILGVALIGPYLALGGSIEEHYQYVSDKLDEAVG